MTAAEDEPLSALVKAGGSALYAAVIAGAVFAGPRPLAVAVGWGVIALIPALLYLWRGESFWEGWVTGIAGWPLAIPYAIFGLRK